MRVSFSSHGLCDSKHPACTPPRVRMRMEKDPRRLAQARGTAWGPQPAPPGHRPVSSTWVWPWSSGLGGGQVAAVSCRSTGKTPIQPFTPKVRFLTAARILTPPSPTTETEQSPLWGSASQRGLRLLSLCPPVPRPSALVRGPASPPFSAR